MSRFSSRIALIGVGAVLVAAGIAGCGGSSDDESSDALSKDDYIAQANEICAGLTSDIEGPAADFGKEYQAGEYEAAAATLGDANEQINASLDELKALTPPEEDRDTIDEFLSLHDDQAAISEDMVDSVAAGDDAAFRSAGKELEASSAKSDKIADDYGMADCGSAGNA
jgi:hypothetical protein